MRLDKYLKVSRVIKRRTVAASAASSGRVEVNGRVAKPGQQVKVGDEITIAFGQRPLRIRVKSVAESIRKEQAEEMYEVLES